MNIEITNKKAVKLRSWNTGAYDTDIVNATSTYAYIRSDSTEYYEEGYYDEHVIPDKYNTGLSDSSLLTSGSCIIDLNGGEYKNKTGTVIFSDKDFTNDTLSEIRNGWGYTGEGLEIKFINCKFKKFRQPYVAENVNVVFENCTFMTISSVYNGTFNNCFCGNFDTSVDSDAFNLGSGSVANDCYIANIVVHTETQGSDHIDGSQVRNMNGVTFNNCRWECVDINYTTKQGDIAYAIYIQDSHNVKLDHCHINGGGNYSISCTIDADTNEITNSYIGQGFITSAFYPTAGNVAEAITKDAEMYNSLFVSSVWKDEDNHVHFVVSNDTKEDRVLTVITSSGTYTYPISRMYTSDEYAADTKDFDDMPFDVEYVIAGADYLVFMEEDKQLRFVNYTGSPIPKLSY